MKIARNQIQKIHIAKKELALTEEDYRAVLLNFNVTSSKALSYKEAEKLLVVFQELGWKPKTKKLTTKTDIANKTKYDELIPRPFGFASPGQLRKVEAIYRDITKSSSNDGLNKLLKKIVKIDHLTWLKKKDVPKILTCLENMRETYTNKKYNTKEAANAK